MRITESRLRNLIRQVILEADIYPEEESAEHLFNLPADEEAKKGREFYNSLTDEEREEIVAYEKERRAERASSGRKVVYDRSENLPFESPLFWAKVLRDREFAGSDHPLNKLIHR